MTDTVSNIPAPSSPLLLPNGSLSPSWWQFFVALYTRTGNAQGVDVELLKTAFDTLKTTLDALVVENATLTQQVADITAELSDYKTKYTPAGFISAQSSGVKRKLAIYNEEQ